ncbi:MAG: hypothetical protein JWO60_411 [Frankiales bacterium]|nr:hypothetical protein [Frankiales bacterium]
MEAEPQPSRVPLEVLAEHLPGAVVAVDLEHGVVHWNRAAERLYGWTSEEALGRSVRELMLAGAEEQADEVAAASRAGERWEGEFLTRRKDGSQVAVYVANSPVRDASGTVVGIVGVSLDLSTYRAQVQARQSELEQAWARAERLADRNARLLRVSGELGRALTAEEVVQVVLTQGVGALEVEAGGIALVDRDRLRVVGSTGYEQHLVDLYEGLPLADATPLTDVVRLGVPWRTDAPDELYARYPALPHSVLSASFAAVPLALDGRVLGVMALSSTRRAAFPPDEMGFLVGLGHLCAQALERSRLFAAERAAASRARFLAEASERLSASLDAGATLDVVASLAVPAVADWCSVHLLDEQGRPELVGVHHRDPERLAILRGLFERYPPEPDRGAGVGQAVGEARLVHHRAFTEGMLRAIARDDEHLAGLRRLRLGSALVVPLQVSGRTLGVLTLVRDAQDAWDDDEVLLVGDLAHRMATAVDNALRFRRERDTALTLQRSLLPRVLPDVPGLRFAHRYLPGTEGSDVGGDWYDVLPLPGGLVGLAIGDVMGRGVEAAAVMGQLRAALRAYAMVEPSPGAVLSLLDAAVASLEQNAITTCLYAVLDPATRQLRIASAGHLPPLLVHASGGGEYLELDPGPPLGVAWDRPAESELVLPEGSVLLLYTDGLVEDRAEPLEDGLLRLRTAAAVTTASPDLLCEQLLRATGRDGRLDDDCALLAVCTQPGATGADLQEEHLHLAGHLSEVGRARRRAVAWARTHRVDEDVVALLVTELASNALRHGGPGVDLWLRATAETVRVEVVDGRGSTPPRVQDPDDEAEGGRGLVLVAALASRWGSERLAAGKSVWFEIDLEQQHAVD